LLEGVVRATAPNVKESCNVAAGRRLRFRQRANPAWIVPARFSEALMSSESDGRGQSVQLHVFGATAPYQEEKPNGSDLSWWSSCSHKPYDHRFVTSSP
jgi:hypothetical protein